MSIWMAGNRARKKSAQKKKKHPARRRRPVLGALALPEDVTGNSVRVIVLGCGRALVENHLGVADISQECIRLTARDGMLSFYGRELLLADVREGALAVSGRIERIELPGVVREEAAPGD